ncbi:MAG: DUF481 domain-containing protein [Emcibacter sp.]|nr:DUF481 domain-containing protein [Emcibacter sp.]
MPHLLKIMSFIAVFLCLLSQPALAKVKIAPEIIRILTVAAKKDNGANLDLVADMAISANPTAKKAIQGLVQDLKAKYKAKPVSVATATSLPKKKTAEVVPAKYGYFDMAGWDGEAEVSYLRSSGNTQQSSLGLGGKMERNTDRFHHLVTSFFDYNRNSGITDKRQFGLSYKLDYDFSETIYMTGLVGYENDKYGAFNERITTSYGLGYPVISNETYSWKMEAGPSILLTKESANEAYKKSVNAFANSLFKWVINDRSKLTNNTIIYFGNKSVFESKTALKIKINGDLSSKFSYEILYDSDAPLDRKKTDTITRIGLMYDF